MSDGKLAIILIILSLLITIQPVSASKDHVFGVQVVDQKLRPVGEADVNLYYWYNEKWRQEPEECAQRYKRISVSFYNQKTKLETGMPSNDFWVSYGGSEEYYAECWPQKILITAEYLGAKAEKVLEYVPNTEIVPVELTLYDLTVRTKDEKGRELTGIQIEGNGLGIGTFSGVAGEHGYKNEQLPPGTKLSITGRYGEAETHKVVELDSDKTVDLVLPSYDITVAVVDYKGEPVKDAVVEFRGGVVQDLQNTDMDGKATITQVPKGTATVNAKHSTLTGSREFDVVADETILINLPRPTYTLKVKSLYEGAAVPHVDVEVTGEEDFKIKQTTAPDGLITLTDVPEGNVKLTLFKDNRTNVLVGEEIIEVLKDDLVEVSLVKTKRVVDKETGEVGAGEDKGICGPSVILLFAMLPTLLGYRKLKR